MTQSRLSLIASLLAATGAALVGCGRDSVGPPGADPLVAQLVALGFRPDMIEDRGDHFLVEGDILISKAAVPRLREHPPLRTLDVIARPDRSPRGEPQPYAPGALQPQFQYSTDVLVGQTQVQNIIVDVSGLASEPAWQTAAREALGKWNTNVNCSRVHLAEGTPADIVFSTDTFPEGTAAVASFPADAPAGSGKPGPRIRVNTRYTGTPNDSLTKLRNMVHEIGHTIGFRHTNWQTNDCLFPPCDPGEYGANQIGGTTTDSASVMNGGTATEAWASFSDWDQVATRILYKDDTPSSHCVLGSMTGPTRVQTQWECTWYGSADGGSEPYAFSWFANESLVPPYGSGTTYTATAYNPGSIQLSLTVRDAEGRIDTHTRFVEATTEPINCFF